MAHADRLNKVYSELFAKILGTAVLTMPILFMSKRFFVERSNIPITKQYPYPHLDPTHLIA